MPKYKYYIEDDGGSPDDAEHFESSFDIEDDDLDYIASDAGEFHFMNCDGWESNWPLIFVILDEKGKEIGRCNVELEHEPVFMANIIKI